MRFILLAFLLLTSQIVSQGQNSVAAAKRAFEGTWLFDTKESDRQISERYRDDILKISVTDQEFTIFHTFTVKSDNLTVNGLKTKKGDRQSILAKLFTDGRGEVTSNSPLHPETETRSRTRWNKNTLEREYDTLINGNTTKGSKTTQLFEVSKDGTKLTVSIRPPMEMSMSPLLIARMVFRKQN